MRHVGSQWLEKQLWIGAVDPVVRMWVYWAQTEFNWRASVTNRTQAGCYSNDCWRIDVKVTCNGCKKDITQTLPKVITFVSSGTRGRELYLLQEGNMSSFWNGITQLVSWQSWRLVARVSVLRWRVNTAYSTHPHLIKWVLMTLSSGIRRSERETDHLSLLSVKVKNA